MRFSFQYRFTTGNETERWHPKVDLWKTEAGARKAAAKWRDDMAAESCPVECQVGKIENNRLVIIA